MIKRKKVSYQMKNNDLETENEVRKMKRLSFGCLGEVEKPFCHERLGRNETEITRILFIGNLSFSIDRELSRFKRRFLADEELLRI